MKKMLAFFSPAVANLPTNIIIIQISWHKQEICKHLPLNETFILMLIILFLQSDRWRNLNFPKMLENMVLRCSLISHDAEH